MIDVDFNSVCFILDLFKESGSIMPINERLYSDRADEECLSVEGVYMFYQQDNSVLIGAGSILYVGRSGSLSKRFNEHKNQWLKKYLVKYPNLSLWYGHIPAATINTLHIGEEEISVPDLENMMWQNANVLGLKRLNTIQEMVQS